jgi:hypothetical protein
VQIFANTRSGDVVDALEQASIFLGTVRKSAFFAAAALPHIRLSVEAQADYDWGTYVNCIAIGVVCLIGAAYIWAMSSLGKWLGRERDASPLRLPTPEPAMKTLG